MSCLCATAQQCCVHPGLKCPRSLTCMCTQTHVRHTRTLLKSSSAQTALCNLSHTSNRADAALEPLGPMKSLNLCVVRPARACVWPATVPYVQEGRLWACTKCTPKCAWAGRPGNPCKHGWGGCVSTCVCACVWHKQETGLWPLLLPCGRALQNMPDRWRQLLTTDLPHLPRPDPLLHPAHVKAPDWTSEV